MNILFRDAFLLEDGNLRWVAIDDEKPLLKQSMHINAKVKADGNLEGIAYARYFDYAKSYVLDSTTKEDEEDKFFDKSPQGLKINSVKRSSIRCWLNLQHQKRSSQVRLNEPSAVAL